LGDEAIVNLTVPRPRRFNPQALTNELLGIANVHLVSLRHSDETATVVLSFADELSEAARVAVEAAVAGHDGEDANTAERAATLARETAAAAKREDITMLKEKRRQGVALDEVEQQRVLDYLLERL
jgi:hypothetical protein